MVSGLKRFIAIKFVKDEISLSRAPEQILLLFLFIPNRFINFQLLRNASVTLDPVNNVKIKFQYVNP